jgi:Flp pilus assembly protein TadD
MNPDVSGGYYDLARTYFALNRFPEAEPYARQAAALKPNFPDSHVVLGYVLFGLRNEAGARDELHTYLRLDPDGPMAQSARAILSRIGEAIDTSNDASNRQPGNP